MRPNGWKMKDDGYCEAPTIRKANPHRVCEIWLFWFHLCSCLTLLNDCRNCLDWTVQSFLLTGSKKSSLALFPA